LLWLQRVAGAMADAGSSAEVDPLDNTAAEPAAAPSTPPAKKEKRAKGFLLSARSAQDLPPAEAPDAADPLDNSVSETPPAAPSVDESAEDSPAPEGKLKPKKKGSKKKGKGGKEETPKKGGGEAGGAETPSPAAKGANKMEGMISRRPGGLNHFMPEGDLEEEEEEEAAVAEEVPPAAPVAPQPEAVPATWQDATRAANEGGEVQGVQVKKEKKDSRLSRMVTRGRRKDKGGGGGFEAKAKLAYYGSIGGGFGTPRVGFAPGQFNTPTWMATLASGSLVVSSTFAHEVQVLTPRGAPASVITSFQDVNLHDPQGIVIQGDSMYVADGGNGRVLKYKQDAHGTFQPVLATQAGLMDLPQGLAYDGDGGNPLLFVVCGRMNRVHVLDATTLRRLFSFGGAAEGTSEKSHAAVAGVLNDPTCVAIYNPPNFGDAPGVLGGRARKLVFVSDTENDRVAAFSMDGDFVASIGKHGRAPGEFVEPLGICIREQQLFVAEGGRGIGGRLQVLHPDGTPLLVLPSPTAGRLVGVHWHDSRLYVSEIEAHRLHAFKIVC